MTIHATWPALRRIPVNDCLNTAASYYRTDSHRNYKTIVGWRRDVFRGLMAVLPLTRDPSEMSLTHLIDHFVNEVREDYFGKISCSDARGSTSSLESHNYDSLIKRKIARHTVMDQKNRPLCARSDKNQRHIDILRRFHARATINQSTRLGSIKVSLTMTSIF